MKKVNVTKPLVLKKGKAIFGETSKFTMWLNTDNATLECKPITLWETKKGLSLIYDELVRIEHGVVC